MYKALKNFTSVGKTYLVGDDVPASLAATLDSSLVEAPKTVSKPKKTYTPTKIGTSVLNEGE